MPLRSRFDLTAAARMAARPLGLYAASRLVVLLAMAVSARLVPEVSVTSAMKAWDGSWYLDTAILGYPDDLPVVDGHVAQNRFAFFPLYPLAIRLLHALGLGALKAGMAVTVLAGAAAVVLLWRLLDRLWGAEAADKGVALFCFFPGSVVLTMVYSEALMLALSIGCLLALLSRRWVIAGVLAGLATACRPNAVALVAACGWAAFVAIRRHREWRALAAPLLAPAGLLAYLGFTWARTGEADAWFRTQREGWGEDIDLGAFWDKIRQVFDDPAYDTNATIAVLGFVFMAVTLVVLLRAHPPTAVIVYTLGIVALAMFSETLSARPRFLLTAFPLVAVLGRRLSGTAYSAVLGGSAVLLGTLTIMTLTSPLATP